MFLHAIECGPDVLIDGGRIAVLPGDAAVDACHLRFLLLRQRRRLGNLTVDVLELGLHRLNLLGRIITEELWQRAGDLVTPACLAFSFTAGLGHVFLPFVLKRLKSLPQIVLLRFQLYLELAKRLLSMFYKVGFAFLSGHRPIDARHLRFLVFNFGLNLLHPSVRFRQCLVRIVGELAYPVLPARVLHFADSVAQPLPLRLQQCERIYQLNLLFAEKLHAFRPAERWLRGSGRSLFDFFV